MQANRKTKEGASHPDRDEQFRHINAKVKSALEKGEPAISGTRDDFHGEWNYVIKPHGC